MSSDIAIRARGLSKCYPIFDRPEDRLKQMLSFGRRKYYREFWAVRNVDLDVYRGETVGIVGRNGSGKSTLLQLIAGVLTPSIGEISVYGRTAALLELGSGFNPDFTGRENALLNAAVLGLTLEEAGERMNEVIDFADIGTFIDQPVRTYSSGMFIRLAFAVAININPSVLIVDEALAVGDLAFQRKCFRKIEDLITTGGTLLFVSHDLEVVKRLCARAIYLERGETRAVGEAKAVCREYETSVFGASQRSVGTRAVKPEHKYQQGRVDPELIVSCEKSYGDGRATIEDLLITGVDLRQANVFEVGQPLRVSYLVRFTADVDRPIFGMMLSTREGVCVFGANSTDKAISREHFGSGDAVRASFELQNNLAPGVYYLTCGVHSPDTDDGLMYLHRRTDAMLVRSVDNSGTQIGGVAYLYPTIQIEKVNSVHEVTRAESM